ncbi:MAG: hypothetical protein CM1200mP24_07990 [Gammaproteobacteria bacterium]|nr:MAG: hypothetical protein CM1200mP24_07990 [Gammaproteobacteria bacterium]
MGLEDRLNEIKKDVIDHMNNDLLMRICLCKGTIRRKNSQIIVSPWVLPLGTPIGSCNYNLNHPILTNPPALKTF